MGTAKRHTEKGVRKKVCRKRRALNTQVINGTFYAYLGT